MPKLIPAVLIDAFGQPTVSTCYLIRIEMKNGEVKGFTSADFLINFDDGFGVVAYEPDEELRPQNIQSSSNMTVDNTKLQGWFSEELEQNVVAGMLDSAKLQIYRVAYLQLEKGFEIVASGTVGEIEYNSDAKDRRKIEFRSLTRQLTDNKSDLYSLTCRTEFGSEECGMPFVWQDGTIDLIPGENAQLIFKVVGISQPAGWFDFGIILFESGANEYAELEIESWAADGTVKLSYLTPYQIEDGASVKLRRDCGKTEADCIAYGNIVNMRAEHLTPAEDVAIGVPGAYI